MRIVPGCVLLALLALIPGVASAQVGTASDVLSESIINTGTGAPVPIAGPPPLVTATFPESQEPFDAVITLPPRDINFIEPQTQLISDRLSILTQYQVRVASDANPNGLPRRTNATLIPASAFETFQPFRISATSGGEVSNQTAGSDTVSVILGWFGPGTGTPLPGSPFTIPEPSPDDVTEPVVTFVIPPTAFDLEQPAAETGGVLGKISDYVDILTPIEIRFISSDNPQVYVGLPPASGFIVENFETGGGVRVALDFVSDAVPEPASFALLGIALLSASLFGYRRKLQ